MKLTEALSKKEFWRGSSRFNSKNIIDNNLIFNYCGMTTQKIKLLRCAKILRKKSTQAEKVFWNYEVLTNLEKILQKIAKSMKV